MQARAVTALAVAVLVTAGPARMITRGPVIVFVVPWGAIQMTWQPEATRRVMSLWTATMGRTDPVANLGDRDPAQ